MLNIIRIEETDDSPFVLLDKENNIIEMKGCSMMEDAHKFYEPIREWIIEYVKNPNDYNEFIFHLSYFNTSSTKMISKILMEFNKLKDSHKPYKILWRHRPDDDYLKRKAREFQVALNLPIELEEF